MPTASILGKSYQTKIFGGIEWMMTALDDSSSGTETSIGDASGRLYSSAEIAALINAIGDGWRLPTSTEWNTAGGGPTLADCMPKMKEVGTAHWTAPNTGAQELYGFKLLPFGLVFSSGGWATNQGLDCAVLFSDPPGSPGEPDNTITTNYAGDTAVNFLASASAYLVRTAPNSFHMFTSGLSEIDLVFPPERGYEPKISPSLEWQRLTSGLWRAIDDGAVYDAHDAEIVVYVTGATLSEWETFYHNKRSAEITYIAPDGVLPFGPHIPIGISGVPVKITGWKNGGKVGITADLWKLTISMRLQQGYTPTEPDGVPTFLSAKYASPEWSVASVVHQTDDGRTTVTSRSPESQTCTVIVDALTAAAASSAVNWALYTRGSSFVYSPPAGLYPFGPSKGSGPFTVRLIGWTIQKPNPRRWDMTFVLAKE